MVTLMEIESLRGASSKWDLPEKETDHLESPFDPHPLEGIPSPGAQEISCHSEMGWDMVPCPRLLNTVQAGSS